MRSVLLVLLAASALAACGDPVAQQAKVDTRLEPARADTMLAVGFRPGTGQLDPGQTHELQAMVAAGRAAERDEFVVVTDGSGGSIQQARARQVAHSLSNAGARWVGAAVEPAMAMGPEKDKQTTFQHEIVCLDDLVPAEDRYRRLDELVDWSFIRAAAAPYSGEQGRPSVDPIVW